MMRRTLVMLMVMAAASVQPPGARAAGPTLSIAADNSTRSVDRDQLLARPDAIEIQIVHDIAYGTGMTYHAVPLAALLDMPPSADKVLEVEAEDGFVAELPLELVENRDLHQAVAYVAIETTGKPWPPVPGKAQSAAPYYIVWAGDRAASVPPLDWPYQVVRMSVQDAPAKRWPALAVDPKLDALDPARSGQSLFIEKCFTCHRLNGAGPAAVGPDLNLPMNPTEYFTDAGLRALIRDSRAVRAWPQQQMPSFAEDQLSDQEIALIVDYLRHMARRKIRTESGGTNGEPP
jgi:mono/diheme cytochrome c family protein